MAQSARIAGDIELGYKNRGLRDLRYNAIARRLGIDGHGLASKLSQICPKNWAQIPRQFPADLRRPSTEPQEVEPVLCIIEDHVCCAASLVFRAQNIRFREFRYAKCAHSTVCWVCEG